MIFAAVPPKADLRVVPEGHDSSLEYIFPGDCFATRNFQIMHICLHIIFKVAGQASRHGNDTTMETSVSNDEQ